MADSYHAAVYWPDRQESAAACARRAEDFFHLLSRCDPIYSRWFEQADTPEEALQLPFEPTSDVFLRFFAQERYQLGREGFSFGAWTGHPEDGRGGGVLLYCGSAAEVAPNSCQLHLPWPQREPEGPRVLNVPVLKEVLRALVRSWEPEVGVIVSDDFRETMRTQGDWRESVGWLMYLSRARGEVPRLPAPVHVEPFEDKGTLIILTPERLQGTNPEHLELGLRVQALMDEKDLLRPVVP
ncbi:Imm52 family immunity protein [Cystobacter fuscus]|uniref:Imm52 family immunity protein n=1 Tax=Cystobacter fuscus TaxID=43 RepID=UPI002B2FE645|nr:hypothetical protein F0U63_27385 [Cystobacter fuscus]